MKWKPFVSGAPYTCQDCPSYTEVRADREHWKQMYEIVAARLYKIENGWSVHVCENPEEVRGE